MPTGPGYTDPQGVWRYGEADENPMTSDLLNRGMSSVSTQLGLIRADITNLQNPPDTDWRAVMPSTTPTVPTGFAKCNTGWTAESSYRFGAFAFRVRDGQVSIGTACKFVGAVALDAVVFVLPVGMRPSRSVWGPSTFGGSSFVHVQPDGSVCVGDSRPAGTNVLITTINFPAAL